MSGRARAGSLIPPGAATNIQPSSVSRPRVKFGSRSRIRAQTAIGGVIAGAEMQHCGQAALSGVVGETGLDCPNIQSRGQGPEPTIGVLIADG